MHAGEIERRGDDIGGIGVHIAARVEAKAAPGELLASRTVKDLVVGSLIRFEDRGTHQLKGVDDDWQLYAVTDAAQRDPESPRRPVKTCTINDAGTPPRQFDDPTLLQVTQNPVDRCPRRGCHHRQFILADADPAIAVVDDPELAETQQLTLDALGRRCEQQLDQLRSEGTVAFHQHRQQELVDDLPAAPRAEHLQVVAAQHPRATGPHRDDGRTAA